MLNPIRPPLERLAVLLLLGLLAACSRGPQLLPDEVAAAPIPPSLAGAPQVAWQLRLPSPPSALLPLGPNALLITSHRGEVYRVELGTGERITPIRQPLRKAITSQLLHTPGPHLYLASARDEEIRAYHLGRGRALWKRKMKGVRGSMAIANGTLLAATISGDVAGFDTTKGRLTWHHKLPGRIYQGIRLAGSLAFTLTDQGILYAFPPQPSASTDDPKDHQPLWEQRLPVQPGAVMAANADMVLIADSDGRLLGIDPRNGEYVFEQQLGAPIYSRPLVTDDLVVVATAAGEVLALRASDGNPQWRVAGQGLIKYPLMIAGGTAPQAVLVAFARGELLALELATGSELWRYHLGKPLELACLTAEGVAVTDRRNQLYYLRLTPPPQ